MAYSGRSDGVNLPHRPSPLLHIQSSNRSSSVPPIERMKPYAAHYDTLQSHRGASMGRGPVAPAIDPIGLVVSECITVTSAMRKHARWAHSSVSAILGGSTSSTARDGARGAMLSPMSPGNVGRLTVPGARSRGSNVGTPTGSEGNGDLVGNKRIMLGSDEAALTSRWGLRGKKGKSLQDNPLMSAFARLRSELKTCKDIRQFDTPSLLHPFLQVIRSSSTSAPITSLAVIAITKFLAYSIIGRDSPRLPLAMQLLSSAITHCRFEASDASTDEVVLLRILNLMESMIAGPGGDLLSDESICEMMECGLSMCCQQRLSEILRRSAEMAMVNMCQVIFERLKHLEIEAGEQPGALEEDTKDDMDAVKMEPSVNGSSLAVPGAQAGAGGGEESRPASFEQTDRESSSADDTEKPTEQLGKPPLAENGSQLDLTTPAGEEEEDQPQIKPYSLPSIRELFRTLVTLLDPHDRQHNDTMRVIALRIVDVALEVAGPSIANHPSLASLAKDTLCRHLFQLVRSENTAILSESLRVAGTLLETCRGVLKLQQELFLSYLVACLFPRVEIPHEPAIEPSLYEGVPQAPSIVKPLASSASSGSASGRSTPVPVKDRQRLGLEGGTRKPDAREAMVENVGALVRMPSFMPELFVNYDCEVDRSDLCTDIVGLLSRNAFPDSATWSTTNVPPLCLDALLTYVQFVAERLDDEPVKDGMPDVARLREQRAKKKVIIKGASKFNEKPKAGIAFLASQGIIDDADNPESVAKFLKGTTRIDKKILGDFISKKDHEDILRAFLILFDFSGLRLDEAIRRLLNSFRLPGEAPLIDRIVAQFADVYCAQENIPPGIADRDAAYVLTYACIMLNTDQHNQNIKGQKRMTYEDFARNLRGTNGKDRGDFDPDYLREIYDSIKHHEIILAEEHDNRLAYDYAWAELLLKIQNEPDLAICATNIFDADMFAATWRPIVATLSFVFMSASDDAVFSRVVTGFHQCAQIAARYGLSDALDRIIYCLSYVSTLASDTPPNTSLNTEVQADSKSVMVSETAVRFGRDDRAQLATVVLFGVVNGSEGTVRDGWTLLVRIMLNLFVNSLIPAAFSSIDTPIKLPPIQLQSPAQVIDRGDRAADTSLFSAFTSYVTSFANDEPPEPSDQEIESTLCTVDCISACELEQIFLNISKMSVDALKALLQPLLALVPQDMSPRVIVVKPELPLASPRPTRPNGSKARTSKQPAYDPTLVFVLELATMLALRNTETVERLGKEVADALQTVIRDSANMHSVVISRAVYYLLHLLRASNEHDFIRTPIVLHELSTFNPELLKECGSTLLQGIRACVSAETPADTSKLSSTPTVMATTPASIALRNEMANSPDFWSILSTMQAALSDDEPTAAGVFAILEEITTEASPTLPTAISTDNYEAAIALLNEFATAGKIGAVAEQRKDRKLASNNPPAVTPARRGTPVQQQGVTPPNNAQETVERAVKAVNIIYNMTRRVPVFIQKSHLEPTEAWAAYWTPIFRALANQSLNPCRQVRSFALSSLQRALLSPHSPPPPNATGADGGTSTTGNGDLSSPHHRAWLSIFSDVLFPLLTRLLKPEVWHSDPRGMGETRVRAATLLCRVFLYHLGALTASSSSPSFSPTGVDNEEQGESKAGEDGKGAAAPPPLESIWMRILELMDRLMNAGTSAGAAGGASGSGGGGGEGLEEAVPESLKNTLLVMAAAGVLVPPQAGSDGKAGGDDESSEEMEGMSEEMKRRLWSGTRERLERFLPGLWAELFPAPEPVASVAGKGGEGGAGGAENGK